MYYDLNFYYVFIYIMEKILINSLKVKKIPKKQIDFNFIMNEPAIKEDVIIKTDIVDKSNLNILDRESFLNKISEKLIIQKKLEKPKEEVQEEVVDELPVDEIQNLIDLEEQLLDEQKLGVEEQKLGVEEQKLGVEEQKLGVEEQKLGVEKPSFEISTKEVPKETKKIKLKRITIKPTEAVLKGPISQLIIDENTILERFSKKKKNKIKIKASSYYLNNRELFINFFNSLFEPYKNKLIKSSQNATCSTGSSNEGFEEMTHQELVRDYINIYTPYRGILLYHGLGSGKTCSSVVIAEGMKDSKKVIVMTPASLRRNYIEEIKKCGDFLYRKKQYWEFVDININPDVINVLSTSLKLSIEYIRKNGGAWLVNMKKKSNFESLTNEEKKSLNNQLDEMIKNKYLFISYNGLRDRHLNMLTNNGKINPFDNAVIVVDEAHNFVSRIISKIASNKKESLSYKLYNMLMIAKNCRIVLLTGTPILNYPNEIAVIFNILRGFIKTWYFKLNINESRKVDNNFFRTLFNSRTYGGNMMDYINYNSSNTTLVFTRNPFGFVNKEFQNLHDGVRLTERGEISDDDFIKLVTKILKKKNIDIQPGGLKVEYYKALPEKLDAFKDYFIDVNNNFKNEMLFKKRILGLTSYFRSAQESLMPRYNKSTNFHVIKTPMSDHQFNIYERARVEERKQDKNRKKGKKNDDVKETSTYRIFSRAYCNFVFPEPHITRPLPVKDETKDNKLLDEDDLDAATDEQKLNNMDGRYSADDISTTKKSKYMIKYANDINTALELLNENKEEFFTRDKLGTYSPKFLKILDNILNQRHNGLHLIYSQFRTLEGIGILKIILDTNGFTQFKIHKVNNEWKLNISEEDMSKPKYALYTGTETDEEKEIIRNVFNNTWEFVPPSLNNDLTLISSNNIYGDLIKVLMITSSGAEGINLRNVRYVHITEPYWHPVRTEQVIGRARRICSHQDLPEELRTVDVFMYLMTLSPKQLSSNDSIELRLKDKSKLDNITPITSDQLLYEISTLKETLFNKILKYIKESSVDCALHASYSNTENLNCLTFASSNRNKFSFVPSLSNEETDNVIQQNIKKISWRGVEIMIDGIKYVLNRNTNEVYDYDSYFRGQAIKTGDLIMRDGNYEYKRI